MIKLNKILLAGILPLSVISTVSASTIAVLESSQTVTNTTGRDQTFNFVSTLPADALTGLHDETGTASFSLLDNNDNGASITINAWHGLINPLPGPPLFDLALLLGDTFTCNGSVACSESTVTTTTASQQHSDLDHEGDTIDSIGIHLNFTLSPGDTAIFDSSWKVSPVPVPAAAWLFASGIVGLFGVAHRKKRMI